MNILMYIVLFWVGTVIGVTLGWWAGHRMKSYGGVIIAAPDEEEGKLIYSLILFNDPKNLIYEREILFRVDTEVEEANRG